MSSAYHVIAVSDGEQVTGIYFDARLLAEPPAPGMAIVADLILPVSYEVEHSSMTPITRSDASQMIDSARRAAIEHSASLGKGVRVGKCFSVTHPDGQCWYEVTSVTGTKAEVEWRGYEQSRHRDRTFGWGGEFDRKVVQGFVARQDAIQSIGGLALEAICA